MQSLVSEKNTNAVVLYIGMSDWCFVFAYGEFCENT